MEKVFCHPEVHHPYIIMRQITSTDFIFQYSPLFPTPKALFISKPLFSIFCYPDQRHFFYFTPVGNKCWIFSMSMGFREHGALVYTHDYPPELLKHSPEASRRNGSLQQQGVGGRHLGPPGTIF